ncbi:MULTISPECIES: hypothetical protein [unclassified Microcoleus]|uniref:hypothetical protein n=1 Tax=unclassified Microcoleus TaxID=2642155 RepID=UPI002FD522C5
MSNCVQERWQRDRQGVVAQHRPSFHKLLHHQQSLLITFKYCVRLQKSLNIRAAIAASC